MRNNGYPSGVQLPPTTNYRGAKWKYETP
jgi:hypothetical protein